MSEHFISRGFSGRRRQPDTAVLRCSACESVVRRIVQTPDATLLDARGAVYLRLTRRERPSPAT